MPHAPSSLMLVALAALTIPLVHCKDTKPEASPAASSASVGAASTGASAKAAASVVEPGPARPTHSGPRKVFANAPSVVAVAGASDPDGGAPAPAPTVTPASVGLPTVDFGPPGPLVMKGYPAPIGSGMDDPATVFGYSKDGAEVIACGHMGAGYGDGPPKGTELGDRCYFAAATGPTKIVGVDPDKGVVGPAFAEKITALKGGSPTHVAKGMGVLPPAVVTPWAFARDLTVEVSSDNGLRIGGRVGAEDPVFSVTVSVKPPTPDLQYSGSWNGILASPDRSELAFIGHFFCMEWCNEVSIVRLPLGRLASLIYNDTGFRHHQKKDYAGSRDLFLKATWANPSAALPPYNLACAYALTNDAVNAEKALKLAIAVGGPKVKARAPKDPDFKSVATAKWFVDLTK
ncbi:MAG: hypothetical protein IPF92_22925 [Myxococcales bacterium]|nr:hypothetical protein [Myxococcales bacterium]MBL0194695.1 hypothetical protein [Myxococcales bacterium]HQY64172.1 hypothetical protein [Polyangiaceae bacterium]